MVRIVIVIVCIKQLFAKQLNNINIPIFINLGFLSLPSVTNQYGLTNAITINIEETTKNPKANRPVFDLLNILK